MAVVTDSLVHEYVAKLATGSIPGHNDGTPTATWVDIVGSDDITLSSFAYTVDDGWRGAGTTGNPYCVRSEGGGTTAGSYLSLAAGTCQNTAFTLEMWVNVLAYNTTYNQVLFYHRDASPDSGFWAYVPNTSNYYSYSVRNSSSYYDFGSGNPVTGAWKHLVLTFASDTWTGYYNGSAATPNSHTYTLNTDTVIYLGRDSGGGAGMNGDWATVRWYSKALSSGEVSTNYAAGVTAASTDPPPAEFTGLTVTKLLQG